MSSQEGKIAIITGANSGLGLETAKALVERGANVILAVRNLSKGEEAKQFIISQTKTEFSSRLVVMSLDLGDLQSIKRFAESFQATYNQLHMLINNAGVMVPPFSKTKDGFELQFGTNHLGHFALTGLLLPVLKKTEDARIITLSSIAHRGAEIYFDNLDGEKGYKAGKFYGQSKLANLYFAIALDEKLKEASSNIKSIGCHPGISSTNLFRLGRETSPWFVKLLLPLISQSAEKGALPILYSATHPDLQGGEYIGPNGAGNRKGFPAIEKPHQSAANREVMDRLWHRSEELTGVTFALEN
ncbi:SDR family NAD(P)-dependent oxidoreductase [Bacillus mesophilus]|uniref:SDR family NAD(P)-dependent oxidoreductase n=2 Tax=Bacillus mesophilus TaxID=1808955 RepID=A0A6M0Q8X0_9BACI|nr:SDR family NAD(P)-dependent oxidoreductase [Bacillus mesophilus]